MWRSGGGCGEYLSETGGFTVTAGSDEVDALVTFLVNGEECPSRSRAWQGGETSAEVSVTYGGATLWSASAAREPASFDGCGEGTGWEGEDAGGGECGCGCADGGCDSLEGDEIGSVRFRVPLGETGRGRLAGFVWFEITEPRAVTPALFEVAGGASVLCASNNPGGALSDVSCPEPGGRRVAVAPAPGGAALAVYAGHGDADPSHSWEITNPSGAGTVRVVRRDGAGNITRDALYTHADHGWGASWTREDLLTGLTESVLYHDPPAAGGHVCEMRTATDSGGARVLSATEVYRAEVGSGPAAVTRETRRWEWDAALGSGIEVSMTWWEDSLNPLRNGKPKFRQGGGGEWEYRAFDARGREVLRAGPLDGSGPPPFASDPAPFALSGVPARPPFDALVTETSYEPLPGDSGAPGDSREPRRISAYAVRGGVPAPVSREWRVFTRGASGGLPAVTRRVIRAASPSSPPEDPANAVSVTVSAAGDDPSVPEPLRGRPLLEVPEDGATNSTSYAFGGYDPGSRTFTEHPDGAFLRAVSSAGSRPLASAEVSDAAFGRVLLRETRLAAGGALLSWEARTHDALGRHLMSAFSDGTAETSLWGCCGLDGETGRDGARRDFLAVPGLPLWSAEAGASAGALPGADGRHPVTETFRDALGRVTNTVRRVWLNGMRDPASAPLETRVEYPHGSGRLRVTTGPSGVRTVTRRYFGGSGETEETVSPGVTSRVTRIRGGATVAETFRDGKRTRETRSASHGADGLRVETVVTESSDGPAVTNSVTAYDFLGRVVSVATPSGVASNFYDGPSGRVSRRTETGKPDTLYEYDAGGAGVPARTALDVDGDGRISYAGPDRITATHETYEQDASNVWWRVTSQAVWAETNSAACVTSSVIRVRLTGLGTPAPDALELSGGAILTAQTETLDRRGNVTRVSTYTDAGAAAVWTVTETPGSVQPAIQKTVAGRTVSMVSSTAVTNAYTYDGFGRQVSATDGRGNTTVTAYNELGQVAYTVDAAGNRTSYAYDGLGRKIAVTDPLGNTTHTAYDSAGNVTAQWGAAYPVAYEYDTAGRRIAMATTRDDTFDFSSVTNSSILNPNSSLDVTRWLYDNATGLLTNKVYADGSRVRYTYTEGGLLATRVWSRGVTTAYSYDALGQLININYSDATPDVAFAYDRMGNMVSVTDASGIRVFTHDPDGKMLSDTLSASGQEFALLESH
ncbi:MAG TPA: hypothetical protein PLZ74_02490, partial [Kiritimatiellia bacterium]|nr:hypothetical protein [Kiritimatiellia bacterium]